MATPSEHAERRGSGGTTGTRIKLNRKLMLCLAEALGSRVEGVRVTSRRQPTDFMIGGGGGGTMQYNQSETSREKNFALPSVATINDVDDDDDDQETHKTCLPVDLLFSTHKISEQQQNHRVAFESTETATKITATKITTTKKLTLKTYKKRDDEPIILRTLTIGEREKKVCNYSYCSIDDENDDDDADERDHWQHWTRKKKNYNNILGLNLQFCRCSSSATNDHDDDEQIQLLLSSLFLLSHCYANDKSKLLYNNNDNDDDDDKSNNCKENYITTTTRRLECVGEDEFNSDANDERGHCYARRRRRRRRRNFLLIVDHHHHHHDTNAPLTCTGGQVSATRYTTRRRRHHFSEQLEQNDRLFDRSLPRVREQMGASDWPTERTIKTTKGKKKAVIEDDNEEQRTTGEQVPYCDNQGKRGRSCLAVAPPPWQTKCKLKKKKKQDNNSNERKTNYGLFFGLFVFVFFVLFLSRNSVPNFVSATNANSSSTRANDLTQTTRAMQEELSRAVMATISTQAAPTSVSSRLRNFSGSTPTIPTASPLLITDYDDDDNLQQLASGEHSTTMTSLISTGTGAGAGEIIGLSTGNSSNQTSTKLEDYFGRTVDFARIFAMVAIMIGDICGNSLVILSVVRHTKLRVTTNWFVVSLACADILVALFAMTFNASVQITGRWIFPRWMCDFWNSCDVLASTASILHLCCISIDRYYAIMRPLDYPMKITTRRVCYALAVVWFSSALLSYIPIFTGIYTTAEHISWQAENPEQCEFVVNRVYAIVSSSISFWIPCCIMVFTYYKIYQEATRQEKFIYKAQNMLPAPQVNHHHHSNSSSHQRAKQRRSKSMAITSLTSSSSSSAGDKAKTKGLNSSSKITSAANKRIAAQQLAAKQQQQQQQDVAASSDALQDQSTTAGVTTGEQQPLTGSAIDINNNNNNNNGAEKAKVLGKKQQQQQAADDQDERDSNSGQSTPTKRSISKMKREHKAAKTLGIIMGVFILCWLPFFSWYTQQHICGKACDGIIPSQVVTLLFWIGYFNSTLNPIIYAYFNHEFRDAFKKTLQWIFCCCRDLKCLRVNRPNDNQHYNCTYRSTQEIGLVTNS